jgi:hypothetical protein
MKKKPIINRIMRYTIELIMIDFNLSFRRFTGNNSKLNNRKLNNKRIKKLEKIPNLVQGREFHKVEELKIHKPFYLKLFNHIVEKGLIIKMLGVGNLIPNKLLRKVRFLIPLFKMIIWDPDVQHPRHIIKVQIS